MQNGRTARRQPTYVVTVRGTRQSASMLIFLCVVFVLSGAAGLVYESIWTRYLGLFVGHSAYAQKPDIPTYLIGDESSITRFHDLVPAPNETYTRLHWAAA